MKKLIAVTTAMVMAFSTSAFAGQKYTKKYINYDGIYEIYNTYNKYWGNNIFKPTTQPTTQVQRPSTQPTTQVQKPTTQPTTQVQKPVTTTEQTTETTTKYVGSTSNNSSMATQLLNLVNNARKQNGLKPLTLNSSLSAVAQKKADDMKQKNYFSHTSPTYGSPFNMIKNAGISYKTAGENIAKGQKTAQAVFNAWMNSPGHKANILNSKYTQMGVGVTNGTVYWSQMFIG